MLGKSTNQSLGWFVRKSLEEFIAKENRRRNTAITDLFRKRLGDDNFNYCEKVARDRNVDIFDLIINMVKDSCKEIPAPLNEFDDLK